jgi:hypothetical protein
MEIMNQRGRVHWWLTWLAGCRHGQWCGRTYPDDWRSSLAPLGRRGWRSGGLCRAIERAAAAVDPVERRFAPPPLLAPSAGSAGLPPVLHGLRSPGGSGGRQGNGRWGDWEEDSGEDWGEWDSERQPGRRWCGRRVLFVCVRVGFSFPSHTIFKKNST